MELFIKKADETEIPVIHEITQEAFKKYAEDLGLPSTVSALKETYDTIKEDMNKKNILIAYLQGKAVGSIRYEILPDGIAYITRFGVRLNTQNCGIGKALINAVEEEAKKLDVSTITLHTATKMTSLIRFYYGMGFYVHSTTTDRGYIRGLLCKELGSSALPNLDCVSAK